MRPEHARILPVLLAAAAFSTPTPLPPARSSGSPFGPFLPVVASHGPVAASYGPEPRTAPLSESDRVEREIQRTDRLIASAEGRVRRSASEKALADLRSSRSRQAEAKEARGQSFYARANRLTLESRAYLKSALIQVGLRRTTPRSSGARSTRPTGRSGRGRTSWRARRPPGTAACCGPSRPGERARRLYKNGAIRGAYAETRDVRSGVLSLLRQSANLPVSRETAGMALRRAERVMEQAQKDAGAEGLAPRPASRSRGARAASTARACPIGGARTGTSSSIRSWSSGTSSGPWRPGGWLRTQADSRDGHVVGQLGPPAEFAHPRDELHERLGREAATRAKELDQPLLPELLAVLLARRRRGARLGHPVAVDHHEIARAEVERSLFVFRFGEHPEKETARGERLGSPEARTAAGRIAPC